MRRMIRVLGAVVFAICAVVGGATLRAVDYSVSPQSGGIGQALVLKQFGFTPTKKPRVRLVPHAGQAATKSVWADVTAFGADEIDATVTSGVAGVYDVVVVPKDKGVDDVTLFEPFTILAPAPEVVDPTSGPAGSTIAIQGIYFGPSKGKVTVGGKKAKVLDWSDGVIHVVLSKKTPVGEQPVVVIDKAGPSASGPTFDVTASAPGGGGGGSFDEYVRADLSGVGRFDLTNANKAAFVVSWNPGNLQLSFGGTTQPAKGTPVLVLGVVGLDVARQMPYDVGLTLQLPNASIATLQYTHGSGAGTVIHTASLGAPGAALTVTVTGWDGTFVTGRFTGTLVDLVHGQQPIAVTNGEFKVRRATGH